MWLRITFQRSSERQGANWDVIRRAKSPDLDARYLLPSSAALLHSTLPVNKNTLTPVLVEIGLDQRLSALAEMGKGSPDFYLWGYLKNRVYKNRPRSFAELHEAIGNEISNIDEENVTEYGATGTMCMDADGRHCQHLL
ncbi:hypothetical protein ANN_20294 [Periplaneta americana]|uniref:Uncharacterized protein n=1 Tax=Periplaneta americana TaxID=6978 RepID=A0ABQ8SDH9_PERAM|nr:hypothetical protein ANN_20294 [Periplaneta americana]